MTPAALWRNSRNRRAALHAFVVTFWTIFGYSLAAHKEFRFSQARASIVSGRRRCRRRRRRASAAPRRRCLRRRHQRHRRAAPRWHQAGTIAVMPYIARFDARGGSRTEASNVSHSLPPDAAFSIRPRRRRHVLPRLFPDVPPGEDASTRFAADPALYLSTTYSAAKKRGAPVFPLASSSSSTPTRAALAHWLTARDYRLTESFHHAHVEVDRELQSSARGLWARCDPPVVSLSPCLHFSLFAHTHIQTPPTRHPTVPHSSPLVRRRRRASPCATRADFTESS